MDEELWRLVRQERLSLVGLVEPLTAEQSATPSLCEEWTVRDVVAHLVMTPAGEPRPWPMAKAMVRARGRLWTAGRDVAVAYARRSPDELVSSLRDLAGCRAKPVFVVDANILLDLVVHGQDVAVPLGLERPVPDVAVPLGLERPVPDAAARLVLERIWTMGWPFHARRRFGGLHLVCDAETEPDSETGTVWQAGSGPEVGGSAAALALLMTGRTSAAVGMLHGPGVRLLAAA